MVLRLLLITCWALAYFALCVVPCASDVFGLQAARDMEFWGGLAFTYLPLKRPA